MDKDDSINFDRLFLVCKTNLNLSQEEFWQSSPRKIYSLIMEWNNMNTPKKEKPKKIYADDLENMLSMI